MLHVVTTGAYYPPVVTTWKILTTGASQLTAVSLCSALQWWFSYARLHISEKYPEDHIQFDIKKIRLVTIDIEVAAESGFPDVENVAEELLLISLQDYATKKVTTFGSRPFVNKDPNVNYIYCQNETILLLSLIHI